MSGRWLGVEIVDVESDLKNIEIFLGEGTPVMLLSDVADTAIEIEVVE
jgi:hypothetical protein